MSTVKEGSSDPDEHPIVPWVQDYTGDLERFLAKRSIIASDIKDICQEVYLRLLRFDRTEMVKNPAAYLYRVAANVAHDFRLRQPQWAPLDAQELDRIEGDASAEDLAEVAARHRALFEALKALPALPRAALTLQAQEDLAHAEIAQRLGISQRAVRRAIQRGHALLREALRNDF
jgi:RNA polymerase sigma factor (sigma-70 family)